MASWPPSIWLRLRTWLAGRVGLWRGRWQHFELEAHVARWTWWPWPWNRDRWQHALYVPGRLADTDAAPLVVLLHGCRQRAMPFAHASGWVRAAERGRFRLLCPEQREGANPYRCWNWFHPPAQAGRGELDVVLQALDAAAARMNCSQVAVVGLSAGGALAALLAFHHAERFAAVVTVAAPPLLGRANVQDPRQVMRHGLALSPTVTTLLLRRCAPLLVIQGAADTVVAPECGEQLAAQARAVLERQHGALVEQSRADGLDCHAGSRLVLQLRRVAGLEHAWSGAPGGHDYVQRDGPALTELALGFLRATGFFSSGGPTSATSPQGSTAPTAVHDA